ncbi:VPLPA-CTERM sorting domain-containing protein [Octadecabacter sp. CECT 8868]|uniref:VPLPA-CTERM sorting domain-containing protein n=1 Tax=Octadecabacter algicola TaxID=2909342 RepID=UPI001F43BCC1|nr:VPLPA-CTERM sorting domain-containing protein [Octadecabacter algicola]MCF2906420.1 VPLPA-CTERM sorting domain-containing protein [Octadecabacter algicola]
MRLISTAAALVAFSSPAFAATLDFSGDICTGGGACSNGLQIDQAYGDIAGELDVVWDADTATAANENVLFWNGNYEDLGSVAYSLSSGTGMSITFAAAAGFDALLDGFSIARYANRVVTTSITVVDLADSSVLLDTGDFETTFDGSLDYVLNAQSSAGFEIFFGPDSWNVGISDIAYSSAATAVVNPSPVPLPAAGWMLLAGLGGMAAAGRRKKS